MKLLFCLVSAIVILTACSSTPTDWRGMGQNEIANWQALDVGSASAQRLKQSGLSPEATQKWLDAGISQVDQILECQEYGFSAQQASHWIKSKFSADNAATWTAESFSAEDAEQWLSGGFDLDAAIKNRSKGLEPIDN